MSSYEYHVVPAPKSGRRAKGVKTAQGRFALALGELINVKAADGWEYVRAETLPVETRGLLGGRGKTEETAVLVFRRLISAGGSVTASARQEPDGLRRRTLEDPADLMPMASLSSAAPGSTAPDQDENPADPSATVEDFSAIRERVTRSIHGTASSDPASGGRARFRPVGPARDSDDGEPQT